MKHKVILFLTLLALLVPVCVWSDSYRTELTKNELVLLNIVRARLEDGKKEKTEEEIAKLLASTTFPKESWAAAIALYQPGKSRILVLRRKKGEGKNIAAAIEGIRAHKRFKEFNLSSPKCRIQLDLIPNPPKPFDLSRANSEALDSSRFEFGVDGLVVKTKDKTGYFLPGDAYVKSILGFHQLDRHLRKLLKVNESEPFQYSSFSTESVISYKDSWLPLYRGYPVPKQVTSSMISEAGIRGAQQMLRTMSKEGRFLYYYDGARDSLWDHEHLANDPIKDPYYNYVRHAGAIPFLLRYGVLTKDKTAFEKAKLAVWDALKHTVRYSLPSGEDASYLLDNKKAKLGGSGSLLYAMMEYERITGDTVFHPYTVRLVRHILGEILPSGEFRYYKIYVGKEVSAEENSKYFGFYYPGEAVVGLASFLVYAKGEEVLKKQIEGGLEKAFDFLLNVRPKKYPNAFPSLPMDSWLVMGINRLWGLKAFQRKDLSDFAFSFADQVIQHMYTENDSPYPDYPGGFYYNFGDFPYPDGARAEGVVAAYQLAQKIGDKERVDKYHSALRLICRALFFLVNTEQSTYMAPNPEMAIGGIRFKLTRQWFRIDTTAHVGNVFLDVAPSW